MYQARSTEISKFIAVRVEGLMLLSNQCGRAINVRYREELVNKVDQKSRELFSEISDSSTCFEVITRERKRRPH